MSTTQQEELKCIDCNGKGCFVRADDFTAHDCESCQGTGKVQA